MRYSFSTPQNRLYRVFRRSPERSGSTFYEPWWCWKKNAIRI